MFNESLLFKEEHEVKAGNILSAIRGLPAGRKVITIYGESGTGKSEVTWWLVRKLYREGIPSYAISMDRFYKCKVDDRTQHRIESGTIGWDEMDWLRINQEIVNFQHKYKRFEYLIVEGLYGGYIKGDNFKVYLEPNSDNYAFRKQRGKENPDDNWRKYVVFRESKCVRASKSEADLIL